MDSHQTTLSLNAEGHNCLERLKGDEICLERVHACSLAIAHDFSPDEKRDRPAVNFGTLDPEGTFQALVKMLALAKEEGDLPGGTLEKPAEWGLKKLPRDYKELGIIPFASSAQEVKLINAYCR